MEIQIREGNSRQKRKLKVCAYCRVSTDADEQENSLENQIRHYEEVITSNPDYEYAGVYSDFAISGFKEKRPGLQKMLADARKGKIDLILTKSVSRFARNTSIVLEATRKLKELNVGVFFELQNINTLSGEGELMLTILAAFAQAESESGSVGAKMVYQRKYEAGIPVQYLERSFGFKKDERGVYIADEEEAAWVRKIYEMAADGYTPASIKRYLNENRVKTAGGAEWIDSTVFRLIENEIYKGDYIMHKHFVNEERKLVRNRGEVDAWYIEDDHEAIIDPAVFDMVQQEMERRKTGTSRYSGVSIFSSKIKCGECGGWYGAKVWHSTDQYRKVIYRCNNKYNDERCTTPHIMEEEVKAVFLKSLNKLLANRDELIENVKLICDKLTDTSELEAEKEKYAEEMSLVADMVQAAMLENARIALDQEEYRQKNDVLSARFEAAKKKHDELAMRIEEIETRGQNLRHFQETLESLNGQVTEFDSDLWGSLVDYITVYENGEKTVTFRDGSVI